VTLQRERGRCFTVTERKESEWNKNDTRHKSRRTTLVTITCVCVRRRRRGGPGNQKSTIMPWPKMAAGMGITVVPTVVGLSVSRENRLGRRQNHVRRRTVH